MFPIKKFKDTNFLIYSIKNHKITFPTAILKYQNQSQISKQNIKTQLFTPHWIHKPVN